MKYVGYIVSSSPPNLKEFWVNVYSNGADKYLYGWYHVSRDEAVSRSRINLKPCIYRIKVRMKKNDGLPNPTRIGRAVQ